jgi:hypothetical protein
MTTEQSAIISAMSERTTFVLRSKSQRGAWLFAVVFMGPTAIFVVGGVGKHPNDLLWIAPAVLLSLLCIAVATSRVTCDANGIRSRLFRTVRVAAAEVTAITVESQLSQSSGRRNVFLVVERTTGKPIRLMGTAMRDKPQNRATLEANADAMRAVLGLPGSGESELKQ